MSYSAPSDIDLEMGPEWFYEITEERPGEIEQSIADADDIINRYLKACIEVPLADPPAKIKRHSVDIAMMVLLIKLGVGVSDERKERYRAAIKGLKAIAMGEKPIFEEIK